MGNRVICLHVQNYAFGKCNLASSRPSLQTLRAETMVDGLPRASTFLHVQSCFIKNFNEFQIENQ